MKIKNYLFMMIVALAMTACSNNDDPTLAQNVAGTYNGYTTADFKYTSIPMTTPDETVSIVANENKTCNITYTSSTWGKFTISDATITVDGNVYAINGSGNTVMGMSADTQNEYSCTIEGTISKDKKTVSLVFSVPDVMGGTTVTFVTGDAPVAMIIAKVYSGKLELSVSGTSTGSVDESKVTITSQDNGKAKVVLAGFGTGSMTIGDITIEDVEVVASSNSTYTLSGTINTVSNSITVTGTLEGTIKDGIANLTFVFKPGAMPMNVTAVFTNN